MALPKSYPASGLGWMINYSTADCKHTTDVAMPADERAQPL